MIGRKAEADLFIHPRIDVRANTLTLQSLIVLDRARILRARILDQVIRRRAVVLNRCCLRVVLTGAEQLIEIVLGRRRVGRIHDSQGFHHPLGTGDNRA